MLLALGPVSFLQCRSIHALIQASGQHSNWNARTVLSDSALAELHFWDEQFDHFHSQPIWPSHPHVAVAGWTDASHSGWGGFTRSQGGA